MRIILSPAKQMKVDDQSIDASSLPAFLDQACDIASYLQSLPYAEAKALWGCSDKLAAESYEQLKALDLRRNLTPAVVAFDGIAFKYMAADVFSNDQFSYIQEHLRILSGFYGVLRPLDGVAPYRLEMQAKAQVSGTKNLYEFWGDRLYHAVMDESHVIVNLASKEYSKCIERYLQPTDTMVTCVFGQLSGNKVVQKGVYAKMARGDMVRFMAENHVEDPREMQAYHRLGFAFDPARSTEQRYVFLMR